MRPIRKRIFLVASLILFQVGALATLAGALWFVKVKETMTGKVVFTTTAGRTIADISVSGQDAMKLERGSVIFADTSAGSFRARVLRRHQGTNGAKVSAIVLQHSKPLSKITRPVDVSMWTRTRRALTIFLDRSDLRQSRTGTLSRMQE